MDYRIGCSGWSYSGWVGPFYPKGTRPGDYLKLYSRVFDAVEIDSTFYRIPGRNMVKSWDEATPDGFRFTAKLPQEITHERKLGNSETVLSAFTDAIRPLGEKLSFVLIQFPASFRGKTQKTRFAEFIKLLPSDISFAVEFRHSSWFAEDVYSMLRDAEITMAWSEVPMLMVPEVITSGSAYLRLVGDRSIGEDRFGTVQRDRSSTIKSWAGVLDRQKDRIRHAFIFANNHFQGFGPFTVNLFREAAGLEPVDWEARIRSIVPDGQKKLF